MIISACSPAIHGSFYVVIPIDAVYSVVLALTYCQYIRGHIAMAM